MSDSDLNQCLEVNKITSVFSSFNLSMVFFSHVRPSLKQSNVQLFVDRSSGSLFLNETFVCHQDRSTRLITRVAVCITRTIWGQATISVGRHIQVRHRQKLCHR